MQIFAILASDNQLDISMSLLKLTPSFNKIISRQLLITAPKQARSRVPNSKLDPEEITISSYANIKSGNLGLPPLITENQYLEALDSNRLDMLTYEKIRFCKTSEISSYLFDPIHEKFANLVMMGGRKDLAYSLMHETFYIIKRMQYKRYMKKQSESGKEKPKSLAQQMNQEEEDIELDPMKLFKQAIENCKPVVITVDIKRGGATYKVPTPVVPKQREWLAMKWLIAAVKDRPKRRTKLFPEVMAQELIDAFYERGKVIKRRDDMHKLAEANRAFAHFRWSQ